jgi:ubiquinone/menaquinone biosynthesis C-methylase UbiE
MSQIADRTFLREDHYKTPANLEARIALHRRFGTNLYGWMRWEFDQLDPKAGMFILDVGCGPGGLWEENLDRLPEGLHVYLCDLSDGMVQRARMKLKNHPGFDFCVCDAQAIPLPGATFNLVTANHMLYHVPDIPRALSEFARIVKPGGRLCVATNGIDHMHELYSLIQQYDQQFDSRQEDVQRFALENAVDIIGQVFRHVELRRYEENLVVTDVEPLLAYIRSMRGVFVNMPIEAGREFESFVRQQFIREGKFFITKSQGIVIGEI